MANILSGLQPSEGIIGFVTKPYSSTCKFSNTEYLAVYFLNALASFSIPHFNSASIF